jgi:hypothetical protein
LRNCRIATLSPRLARIAFAEDVREATRRADLARPTEALVTCLDLVFVARGASDEVTLPIVVSPTPK